MTRDKALDIFLVLFFGMAGITVLVLAWIQPMPVAERILTTSAGSTGLLLALIQTLVFKSVQRRTSAAPVPVEADVKES